MEKSTIKIRSNLHERDSEKLESVYPDPNNVTPNISNTNTNQYSITIAFSSSSLATDIYSLYRL